MDTYQKKRKERHLETIYARGQWFQFPVGLLHLMSPNEAVVLAELMNESQVRGAHAKDGDGWFVYSVIQMEERIAFSPDVQYRAIKKLQDANRIESEQRGMPAKRCFRINFIGIDEELSDLREIQEQDLEDSAEQGNENPTRQGNGNGAPEQAYAKSQEHGYAQSQEHTTYLTKIRTLSESEFPTERVSSEEEDKPFKSTEGFLLDEDEEPSNSPSNFDMRCAVELSKAVFKNHKSDRRSEIGNWARHFRDLRTKRHASKEQIKEVLLWYVNSDWTPQWAVQAYSGCSFKEKFHEKLLPAMLKAKAEQKESQPSEDQESKVTVIETTQAEKIAFQEKCDREDLAMTEEEYAKYKSDWEKENGEPYLAPGIQK